MELKNMKTTQRLLASFVLFALLAASLTSCKEDLEKRQKDYCPYSDPAQCDIFKK